MYALPLLFAAFLLIIGLRYIIGRGTSMQRGGLPVSRQESFIEKALSYLVIGLSLGILAELSFLPTKLLTSPRQPWLLLPLGGYLGWFYFNKSQPMDRVCTTTGLVTLAPGLLLWGLTPQPPDLLGGGVGLFILTFGFGIWRDMAREQRPL